MEPLEPTPEAERNSVGPEQVDAAVSVARRVADNVRRAVKVTDDVLEHVAHDGADVRVEDPLTLGLDFGRELEVTSRDLSVPSSADVIQRLVNAFFTITVSCQVFTNSPPGLSPAAGLGGGFVAGPASLTHAPVQKASNPVPRMPIVATAVCTS